MKLSAATLPAIPAPISPELLPERRWSGGPATIIRHTYIRGRCRFTALITRHMVCRRFTTRMLAPTPWVATRTDHTARQGERPGIIRRPARTVGPIRNNIPTAEERAHGATILPPAPHGLLSKGTATTHNGELPPLRVATKRSKPVTS